MTDISKPDRLAELASDIRLRGKRAAYDIVEIGRDLVEAKALLGHGNWLPWLESEFGWTDQTARNLMRVYDRVKSKNFLNLDLSVSALYQLTAPSTPPAALDTAIERTQAGEKLSGGEIAPDGERLLIGVLGVAEPVRVVIDVPQIAEGPGQIGSVGGGVLGGEVASDGERLLIGGLGVAEPVRVVIDVPQIAEDPG